MVLCATGQVHPLPAGFGEVKRRLLPIDVHHPGGDAYPVAGGNWTQLTISLANFDRLARSPTGLRVVGMVNCGGGYGRLIHGIASRPKPPPPPRKPATVAAAAAAQQQPHPQTPQGAHLKALGAIHPTVDMQGTVCLLCSSVVLAEHSSIDLAKLQLEVR